MPRSRDRSDVALARTLDELLARIAAAERRGGDELEKVVDEAGAELRALQGPALVPALRRAGRSAARRGRVAVLLSLLDPGPDTTALLREWIADPSPEVRSTIIQAIGAHRLEGLAPLLADRIANDEDAFCRDMAVHAAGVLRAEACLPEILALVDSDFPRWRLAQTLARYASDDVRPYLTRWFEDEAQPHEVRVQAAWGLAKLGDERAFDYLVECLERRTGSDRFRSAQAICDVKGWPFEWRLEAVERTAERIRLLPPSRR